MAPKHALFSSSGSSGPEVGLNCCFSPTAWIVVARMVAASSPRCGTGTRALSGMLARCFVTIGAVLMLMTQSSLAINGKMSLEQVGCLWFISTVNRENMSRQSSAGRSDSVGVKLA